LDDAVAKAQKKLIRDLKSVTKWAAGKRLTGFRHRTFELILTLDSDDRRARGVLKYKRKNADSPWVQDPGYRQPPDWGTSSLPKAEAKERAAIEKYRDAVLEALDAHGSGGSTAQEDLLEHLAGLLPKDAAIQKRLGRVEVGGRWMLPDTVKAHGMRAETRVFVRRAHGEEFLLAKRNASTVEKGWDMAWKNERRLVYGEVSSSAGRECLADMEVAERLCDRILEPLETFLGPSAAILLKTREQARVMVKRHPEWADVLPRIERLAGLYLPDGTYLSYRADSDAQRSAAVRQVINDGLRTKFAGHERGWITEGAGQRMTWYVLQRHGPAFVSLESTEMHTSNEEGHTLPEDPAAWNRAAAAVLKRDGPARLAGVMTRRLNAMGAPDVLVAYGLAAFLMETRPQAFLAFTRATIKRHDVDAIVKETLGADDVKMLASFLRRWCLEN